MAIDLTAKQNTIGPTGEYPFGQIKNNPGNNTGTPVNKAVMEDYIQFFHKMFFESALVYNGVPDNEYDDWQFWDAFKKVTGIGEWTEVAYDSALLDTNNGTWTIASSPTNNFKVKYIKKGKTVTIAYNITNSTLSATPSQVRFILPDNMKIKTGSSYIVGLGYYTNDAGSPTSGINRIEVVGGLTYLRLVLFSGNYSATITPGGFSAFGQITFEVD